MIVKQELVKKIKDHFDLNIYETKVWLALLSKGVVSAGETAELSGVPRSRTYDVLESLAKRGFAIVKIGKPVKYIAVEPKTIIEKMKTNTLNQANEKIKILSNLKDTDEFVELEQLHKVGISPVKAEDLSGAIKGKSHVNAKIREILESAEKEVSICTSVSDFEKRSRVLLPVLSSISDKGIKVKLALSGDNEKIKKLSFKNVKPRLTENKGRFVISDRKETLCMITNESVDEEIGLWISAPFFAEALSGMFDISLKN